MKEISIHPRHGRVGKPETDFRTHREGWYGEDGISTPAPRLYAFLMPSQGRRLSIVAFDHSKAVAVACNVWRTTPAQLILLFSYPLRARPEAI